LRSVEKVSAAHFAMNVVVKYIQQLLREIGRFFSFHSSLSLDLAPGCRNARRTSNAQDDTTPSIWLGRAVF
jgi:hypothetical protein